MSEDGATAGLHHTTSSVLFTVTQLAISSLSIDIVLGCVQDGAEG